jgi:hypothetical protein
MPRAVPDASDMAPRIGQTPGAPKKIIAPARIERLLKDQICLPVLYNGGYYSAGVTFGDALSTSKVLGVNFL